MTSNEFAIIIAEELNLLRKSVHAVIKLLDDGATIPFISRYRKEATGAMDETSIRNISQRYEALKALQKRKETIIDSLKEQNALTPELLRRIEETREAAVLEDIYLPYRPKRRTRASIAAERGLEPLARQIMAQNIDTPDSVAARYVNPAREVPDTQAALAGASDIIAEWMSESEKARSIVRARYLRNATITARLVPGKENDPEAPTYENYFDYSAPLRLCTSHRFLAINRAATKGILKTSLSIDDDEMIDRLGRMFVRPSASEAVATFIRATVRDSYRRLIRPSIETEVLNLSKAKADDAAIAVFADNVRQLLMASPLGHRRVMGVDPGYVNGCKIVCLDENGALLCHDIIYPLSCKQRDPRREGAYITTEGDFHGSAFKICSLVDRFGIEAIAVGNGTGGRDTEQFLNSLRYPRPIQIYVVNEAGASVYSTSQCAIDEFPDKDPLVRGAVSIGRRLLDPLAELVKIDPQSIGVGQYQHDVDQPKLKEALDYTVVSCVNSVGVNVNTASRELLSYVSGIGPALAANIVAYRNEHGAYRNRAELLNVPRMGEKSFQQSAGFLRIPDGDNILDNTGIHPERYQLMRTIAADNNATVDDFVRDPRMLQRLDLSAYVTKEVGLPTLTDMVIELEKPGRDPREPLKETPVSDNRIQSIADIQIGMELEGTVNNLTAFGCFVDLGIHENGLIHISQLADRFVSNPAEVVSVGQRVKVRVIELDPMRGRIGLSMKDMPQH